MRKTNKRHIFLTLWVILSLFMSSCIDNQSLSSKRSGTKNSSKGATSGDAGDNGGQGSVPGNGSVDTGGTSENASVAEIRHIVDPFDGTYKTKVTIPKNFTGLLYLSGLNFTSLANKIVYARFRFGRELEPVIIQGTIGRAPGITPQTDIEVLILDFQDRPFENIRLLYDLYDYNDYRSTTVANEEDKEPTTDPRDGGLYCRGLRLEHDPTFRGTATNTQCDQAGERCLYAYAKIKDSGLVEKSTGIAINPTEPQLDLAGAGYVNESQANALKKCLPDNNNIGNFNGVLNTNLSGALGWNISEVFSGQYVYKGPFRPIGTSQWEIKGTAILSPVTSSNEGTGLFQNSYNGNTTACSPLETCADGGFKSFLFPRAGKTALRSGVEYWGNETKPFDSKSIHSLLTSGDSQFMDGCNLRVGNFDEYSNESIASCNISATIDLITIDQNTGQESVLTSSREVKLQLIRSSNTDYQGREVLYSSMKSCSTSNACGSSECCFNSRCWSKELVSQCVEDAQVVGNRGVGELCNSDFECSSLCCNQSTGTCAVHLNTEDQQVLCSKSPGQSCVMKEYCREENLTQCFVVKTGIDAQGQQLCALRCYNVPTFGSCINGICIPPDTPTVPSFDPDNPDCSAAIDPPLNL